MTQFTGDTGAGRFLGLCATCVSSPRLTQTFGVGVSLPDQRVREMVRDFATAYCFDDGSGALILHVQQRWLATVRAQGQECNTTSLRHAAESFAVQLGLTPNSDRDLKATQYGVFAGHLPLLLEHGGAARLYGGNVLVPRKGKLHAPSPSTLTAFMQAESLVQLAKACLAMGIMPYVPYSPPLAPPLPKRPTPLWVKAMARMIRQCASQAVGDRQAADRFSKGAALRLKEIEGYKHALEWAKAKPDGDELLWAYRRSVVAKYAKGEPIVCNETGQPYTPALEREALGIGAERVWPDLAWDLFIQHATVPLAPYDVWSRQPTQLLSPAGAPNCRGALLRLVGGVLRLDGQPSVGKGVASTVTGEQFERAVGNFGRMVDEKQYTYVAERVALLVQSNSINWPLNPNRGGYVGTQRTLERATANDIWNLVNKSDSGTHNLWAGQGKDWNEHIPTE